MYEFKYKDMSFSKDGSLDELLALDRYSVTTYDGLQKGDTVVAIINNKEEKRVATIIEDNKDGTYQIKDRFGEIHNVKKKLLQKPLETEPYQFWSRWAKGGASVEKTLGKRQRMENELRWLFDGFRYSLGGRIQAMLGQEFVTGEKSSLTSFNCFVLRSPKSNTDPKSQFLDVLEVAHDEASVMRRGGGKFSMYYR